MKPLCGVCGDRHEPHQAHRFAASNKVPKKAVPASNSVANASNTASNKQRWDRKAYNEYMRMYMAVKRAVRGGRADWWPRRGNTA